MQNKHNLYAINNLCDVSVEVSVIISTVLLPPWFPTCDHTIVLKMPMQKTHKTNAAFSFVSFVVLMIHFPAKNRTTFKKVHCIELFSISITIFAVIHLSSKWGLIYLCLKVICKRFAHDLE